MHSGSSLEARARTGEMPIANASQYSELGAVCDLIFLNQGGVHAFLLP